jgi:hypothetical protein
MTHRMMCCAAAREARCAFVVALAALCDEMYNDISCHWLTCLMMICKRDLVVLLVLSSPK